MADLLSFPLDNEKARRLADRHAGESYPLADVEHPIFSEDVHLDRQDGPRLTADMVTAGKREAATRRQAALEEGPRKGKGFAPARLLKMARERASRFSLSRVFHFSTPKSSPRRGGDGHAESLFREKARHHGNQHTESPDEAQGRKEGEFDPYGGDAA